MLLAWRWGLQVGVVAYTLLCGYEPFYGVTDKQLIAANKLAEYEFHDPEWTRISHEAKDLVGGVGTSQSVSPHALARSLSREVACMPAHLVSALHRCSLPCRCQRCCYEIPSGASRRPRRSSTRGWPASTPPRAARPGQHKPSAHKQVGRPADATSPPPHRSWDLRQAAAAHMSGIVIVVCVLAWRRQTGCCRV